MAEECTHCRNSDNYYPSYERLTTGTLADRLRCLAASYDSGDVEAALLYEAADALSGAARRG